MCDLDADTVVVTDSDVEMTTEADKGQRAFRRVINATRRYLQRLRLLQGGAENDVQEDQILQQQQEENRALAADYQQVPAHLMSTTQRLNQALDDIKFPHEHDDHQAHRQAPQAVPPPAPAANSRKPRKGKGKGNAARKGKSKGKGQKTRRTTPKGAAAASAAAAAARPQSTGRMLGPQEYFQRLQQQQQQQHQPPQAQPKGKGKRTWSEAYPLTGKGRGMMKGMKGMDMMMTGGDMRKGKAKGMQEQWWPMIKGRGMMKGMPGMIRPGLMKGGCMMKGMPPPHSPMALMKGGGMMQGVGRPTPMEKAQAMATIIRSVNALF